MDERMFYVYRSKMGVQVTLVSAKSKAEAVRKVLDGQGEDVAFEITNTANTAHAMPADE